MAQICLWGHTSGFLQAFQGRESELHYEQYRILQICSATSALKRGKEGRKRNQGVHGVNLHTSVIPRAEKLSDSSSP